MYPRQIFRRKGRFRSGYRYEKLSKRFPELFSVLSTQDESKGGDIITEDAPTLVDRPDTIMTPQSLAGRVSSEAGVEEVISPVASLSLNAPEEVSGPQFTPFQRRSLHSRCCCTPVQHDEIRVVLLQLKSNRSARETKELREREKDIDALRLLDSVRCLPFEDRVTVNKAAAALDKIFSERRALKTKKKSSASITPKRFPLDSKVEIPREFPDYLVTPRLYLKHRPDPSLLKSMMCKKVQQSVRDRCRSWRKLYSIDTLPSTPEQGTCPG
jgi:hypothetical protein